MDDLNKEQPAYWQPEHATAGSPSREAASTETGGSGSAAAARMKLAETAAEVKEKVAGFGRRAADAIDESRHTAAGALDKTASTLHSGGDQISDAAHTAANRLRSTADYLRQTDLKGMGEDVQSLVKRYPGPALAAAALLGFLLARGLRRGD
jgi:ElaB/YqjD/DUF883 family membrane-anchored ribosome-binding protein